MSYRMIAVDLDGTLLGRDGRISAANRAAVAAAQAGGALVVPCTGRAWIESKKALADLPRSAATPIKATRDPLIASVPAGAPGVFVTGATVSDIDTGETLDLAVLEAHLAEKLVRALEDVPEAVLVFRDARVVGHDYLVTGKGALTPNTQWWFEQTGATVHFQRHVTREDLHHTLRVGLVANAARMLQLCEGLKRTFGDAILLQSFQAVQMPDPTESVHVLEVFAAGVDKWRGLQWIAQRHGIGAQEIAVIGDEINDLAMMRGAGCAIAMGNAIESVKSTARYVTRRCEDDGVACAIEKLMAGEW